MKVYLDENLSARVAQILRARGVDAVSAYEVGQVGLDDRAQLRYAAADGRAVVTLDVEDFIALDAETIAANAAHAGMVLIPRRIFRRHEFDALASAIEQLARLFPSDIRHTVLFLGREKV